MDTKSPALYSNKGKAEVLEDYGPKKAPESQNSNRRQNTRKNGRLHFCSSDSQPVYLDFMNHNPFEFKLRYTLL